jgi:hypothetical protein
MPLVVEGVPSGGGNGVLDRHQDPAHQVGIAGVLHLAADGRDRDFIGGGVEVARNDDLGVGVSVEDLVDEPADLQACDIRSIEDMKEPSAQAADRQV